MRTTLNLEDDVLRALRSLARERDESMGSVASSLIRHALMPSTGVRYDSDFPVFEVRDGAAPITPEMVDAALDEP